MRIPSFGLQSLPAVALLILGACARAAVVIPPTPPMVGAEQTGPASWYGHPYHGRRTASGEVFDMRDLTAAHPTLPLGTRLMVTNLDTGRSAEVRVNDRGPFVEGRMLDLSHGAASLLGAVGPGVIPVKVRVISLPGPPASPGSDPPPGNGGFSIQVGAFISRARADSLREVVERDGRMVTISEAVVGSETFYRVRVGPYPDRPAAEAGARRLAARGYPSVVVGDR